MRFAEHSNFNPDFNAGVSSPKRGAEGDLDLGNLNFGPPRSPDLTRRIMGRLGYMRVPPQVARRDRIRRWIGRSGTLVAAALAVGVGLRMYEGSNIVRRPHDVTIPAAIGSDFQRQQDQVGNVIRTFRNLTTPHHNHSMPVDSPEGEFEIPEMIEFDEGPVNNSPFRWV